MPLHGGSLNISGYLERGQVGCHLLSALPKPSFGLIWGTVAGAPQADTWNNQLKDWRGFSQGQGESRPPPNPVPIPQVVFPRMFESADQREGQPGSFQIHLQDFQISHEISWWLGRMNHVAAQCSQNNNNKQIKHTIVTKDSAMTINCPSLPILQLFSSAPQLQTLH